MKKIICWLCLVCGYLNNRNKTKCAQRKRHGVIVRSKRSLMRCGGKGFIFDPGDGHDCPDCLPRKPEPQS